ncbi:hypothetical protein TNCV_2755451 [Trichonephila clavipes]|nr:hypothetical protein TNCV_2755451 [Trichonephila clavipes]
MALSDSLPQINAGVQGGTQGGSNKRLCGLDSCVVRLIMSPRVTTNVIEYRVLAISPGLISHYKQWRNIHSRTAGRQLLQGAQKLTDAKYILGLGAQNLTLQGVPSILRYATDYKAIGGLLMKGLTILSVCQMTRCLSELAHPLQTTPPRPASGRSLSLNRRRVRDHSH